jgi:hypothetical protein
MRVNTLAYYTTELIMGVKSFMAVATKKASTVPINLATVLYYRVHGIHIEIPWVRSNTSMT